MRPALWISGGILVVALVAVVGAWYFGVSAWALGIILVASLAGQAVLEGVERYLPGGAGNPYNAATVGRTNRGRKLLVWSGAIVVATAIWGVAVIAIRYLR